MGERLVVADGVPGVWGVALSSLGAGDREVVEVVEFVRFADVVDFVCAVDRERDVVVSSVFDLQSGYEVEIQFTAHEGQPPAVTMFPRREGRWRTVWHDETLDLPPSFEPAVA